MLVCYTIIVFVLTFLIYFYMFYVSLIVRMRQRKKTQLIHAWYVAEELFYSNENISLTMWRAVIGLFLSRNIWKCFIAGLRCCSISNLEFALLFALLLLCHGDIGSNPGPKKSFNCQPLKFCHWNLNSILSENCFKASLLKSFNALHNYDFIWLSETFLSLSVNSTLNSLNIDVII